MTGPDAPDHRQLRELLGAFVLGALPADAAVAVRAHLDGCAACRAEAADIAPLADDLRTVDPDALNDLPVPPADLAERIQARIAEEQQLARARTRRAEMAERRSKRSRRVLSVAAAVAVVAGALGVGTAVGRSSAPEPSDVRAEPTASTSPRPVEQVAVQALDPSVRAGTAEVIAHTWGVEARFDASGFAPGQVYRAAFRDATGRSLPAGEFLGTGENALRCNMQSALLRSDARSFVVTDAAGNEVLTAAL